MTLRHASQAGNPVLAIKKSDHLSYPNCNPFAVMCEEQLIEVPTKHRETLKMQILWQHLPVERRKPMERQAGDKRQELALGSTFFEEINCGSTFLESEHCQVSSSWRSCRATSTDIPDPLSPLDPIAHSFWQVLKATSRILTELVYVGSRYCIMDTLHVR